VLRVVCDEAGEGAAEKEGGCGELGGDDFTCVRRPSRSKGGSGRGAVGPLFVVKGASFRFFCEEAVVM